MERREVRGGVGVAGRALVGAVSRYRSAITTASFALLALVVTFTNRPGRYIDDFRFEVAWVPGRTLERLWSLWQPTGGFGGIAGSERNLLPTLVFWIAEAFGASPWAAQRIWQALLLFLAAMGTMAVVRFFRPGTGLWHIVAGLAFMFSPTGLGLFRPSPIYAVFAVSPWIVAAVLRGVCGIDPWRWAAVFALAVVFVMPIELPATIYVFAFLPPIAALTIRFTPQASWGRAVVWGTKAGVLTAVCVANVLVRAPQAQGALERRLFITESAEAVSIGTSWSEVYRGIGNWLTYFRFGIEVARPNYTDFLDNPVVVVATCLIPLVAMASLLRPSALLPRVVAPLAILSLIVVVGLHPAADPSPAGRLFRAILAQRPNTLAFRATIKAAWLWALTVAVLFGAVVATVERRCRSVGRARLRNPLRVLVAAGAAATIIASSWPAWSGNLNLQGVDEIPEYWYETAAWLETAPEGQVLVLPGTPQPVYRWGDPGDDILDSLIRRPYLTPNFFTQSTPTTTNLLWEMQQRLGSAFADRESFAPILWRLGVRYVVIRNDLAWTNPGVLRPASFEPFRRDPALRLVAQFGDKGENTLAPPNLADAPLELSLRALEEDLYPIEIYDLGPATLARVVHGDHSLVMEGDGAGWYLAESSGLLDSGAPIAYAAAMTNDELVAELSDGSPVLITDSNVRREQQAIGPVAVRSPSLFANAGRITGFVDSLFESPSSATVLGSRDLGGVRATVEWLAEPWNAATQVIDGDPATAWRVPILSPPIGQSVTLRLTEPGPIGEVAIQRAVSLNGTMTSGFISVDGSEPRSFVFDDDRAVVDLGGVVGTDLTIGINSIDGPGAVGVGFAEIEMAGYDLQLYRDTPSSIDLRARANTDLADALAGTSMSFAFEREQTNGTPPVETSLRRRFTVDVSRRFVVRSLAHVPAGTDVTSRCRPILRIDGREIPSIALVAPASETEPTQFVSCEPVDLAAGTHLVDGSNVTLDAVQLDDVTRPAIEPAPTSPAATLRRGPTSIELTSSGDRPGTLITGTAYHPGWLATVAGVDAATFERDGQLAVAVPAGENVLVELRFGAQRAFGLANLVALAGLLVCALLAMRPTVVTGPPEWVERAQAGVAARGVVLVLGLGAAYLAGGTVTVVAVLSALAIGYGFGWQIPIFSGLTLLVTGTVLIFTEANLEPTFQYALVRPAAASSFRFGLAVIAAVAVARLLGPTAEPTIGPPKAPEDLRRIVRASVERGWSRLRAVDVSVLGTAALLGFALARIGPPGDPVRAAVASLQAGLPYSRAMEGLGAEASVGALGTVIEAFGPLGVESVQRFLLVVAVGLWIAISASSVAAHRESIAERLVAAAFPACTVCVAAFSGSNPGIVLAVAVVTLGCVFIRIDTLMAAVFAGLFAGLAGLCAPEAAIAAPVAIVLVSVAAASTRRAYSLLAVFVAVAINATWWRWLDKEFGLDVVGEAIDVAVILALLVPASVLWLLSGTVWMGDRPAIGEGNVRERE